jgi:hypothetical protein
MFPTYSAGDGFLFKVYGHNACSPEFSQVIGTFTARLTINTEEDKEKN